MVCSAWKGGGKKYFICNDLIYNIMKKTYKENIGMWALEAEEAHVLRRIGTDDSSPVRRTTVRDPEQWEEVAVAELPAYTKAEYEAKVEELIRERYTVSQEFALINNVMANVTEKRQSEYAAYQAYREDCKAQARAILSDSKSDITND